jgi:hypothetical protein
MKDDLYCIEGTEEEADVFIGIAQLLRVAPLLGSDPSLRAAP